ncbi:hypothetical protein B0T20DRAFT_463674 [Sordaria brevicollis]|uniref:Uncharacterized protein n=1 Tax=Sordaria brevicollis TaxID=83679 RepID=A0AAE0U687_SORBR|nr:hypothetical protein B0T20DRAFT_463674 [Sordaria brevicollis]
MPSSPGRPDSPTLPNYTYSPAPQSPPPPNPPPSSPLPLLPPFRLPSGTSRPTTIDTARQQGVLLGLLSSVCKVIESLYQDLQFLQRRFGGDPMRMPREQLDERRKRVRMVWKMVEKHRDLAWEGEVVRGCERMLGDVLRVYHSLINNGESTSTFIVPWGEYVAALTGTISDVEEEVEKAVKKLTTTNRTPSGTHGGGVRIEGLMRPLG